MFVLMFFTAIIADETTAPDEFRTNSDSLDSTTCGKQVLVETSRITSNRL
jgi:hypothetical protein